ncbi:MAG TPA: ATP synthase F1 subunit gamma [Candidatus Limnocylindrales bacterium]|nr:ATP synthase F1 subunit gamma [Candidatus Limnocylindrales bacterium]
MPSLKHIRKRISSVRNTQQITKAMKMVSAAKLRRAQDAVQSARPYGERLQELLTGIAAAAGESSHPFLQKGADAPAEVIVITSDRGLCGGYNANLIKKAETFLRTDEGQGAALVTCGRNGSDYLRKRYPDRIRGRYPGTGDLALARSIASEAADRFLAGEVGAVYLVYSRFRSAISQLPVVERLLPVESTQTAGPSVEYVYEPEPAQLLESLLGRYIQTKVFQAFLEATASEHGARMTAMDSATRNASEMIERLTLQMNRARQASITTELMEIVGGAEALKG